MYKIYTYPEESPIRALTFDIYHMDDGRCLLNAGAFLKNPHNIDRVEGEIKDIKKTMHIKNWLGGLDNGMEQGGVMQLKGSIMPTGPQEDFIHISACSEGPQHFRKFEQGVLDYLGKKRLIQGTPRIEEPDLREIARKEVEKLRRRFGLADTSVDILSLASPLDVVKTAGIGAAFKFLGKRASAGYWYMCELQEFLDGKRKNFPGPPSPQSPRDFGR